MADDIRLGVDDAQVIASTLPPAPLPSKGARLRDEVGHAVESAKGYVGERPLQSMLIAAASGAAITAGLLAFMRSDRL